MIRASIFDNVKSDEVDQFMKEGIFIIRLMVFTVYENGEILPHRCNDPCLVRKPDGFFRCQELDNVSASSDSTKHIFMNLPKDYSIPCLKILQDIGLISVLTIDKDGNVLNFKSPLEFLASSSSFPAYKSNE